MTGTDLLAALILVVKDCTAPLVIAITKSSLVAFYTIIVDLPKPGNAVKAYA